MAFTSKDWKDSPDETTPITAAALEDLESRVAGYTETYSQALAPTVSTKSTDYTLVLTDAGDNIHVDDDALVTITVPTNASVAFDTGTVITLTRFGVGGVKIAPASGVVIRSLEAYDQISGRYGQVQLRKVDTNDWLLTGDLSSGVGGGGGLSTQVTVDEDTSSGTSVSMTHDPGSTAPRAAIVFVFGSASSNVDHVDGASSFTYGSTSMTNVITKGPTTGDEYVSAEVWFADGISSGQQTVAFTKNTVSDVTVAIITLEADSALEVLDSGGGNGNANSSGYVSSISTPAEGWGFYGAIYAHDAALDSFTDTELIAGHDTAKGYHIQNVTYSGTAGTDTVGWTYHSSNTEEEARVGLTIQSAGGTGGGGGTVLRDESYEGDNDDGGGSYSTSTRGSNDNGGTWGTVHALISTDPSGDFGDSTPANRITFHNSADNGISPQELNWMAKFYVYPGDDDPAGTSNERCEYRGSNIWGQGTEAYFRFLFNVYDWDTGYWGMIWQIHGAANTGNPPVSAQFLGSAPYDLWIGHGSGSPVYTRFDDSITEGTWYELAVHVYFHDTAGYVEAWLDGVKGSILTTPGYNTRWHSSDQGDAYEKTGIYRGSGSSSNAIVYQDGYKVTTDFYSNPPS